MAFFPRFCSGSVPSRRFFALIFVLLLSSVPGRAAEERFAFERAEMGVPFRITLYAPDEATALAAAEAAFARVAQLNAILTDYDSDSELSRLSESSGKGQAVPVSEDLWRVLETAQRMAERSGGAFDVTVGPLVNLWRMARHKQVLPSPERLAEGLGRVGYTSMHLNPAARTVELAKLRMRLDVGGIAKGYAVEEALKTLTARGFAKAMVMGGGDMMLGEAPPGEKGWRIEVPALDEKGAPVGLRLCLQGVAVSTSGDRYQRLEIGGKRYSHVVDPRTGLGLTDHSLVTVVARHGMEAETLSKIVSVLGAGKGLPLVEETPGASAHVVRAPEGRVEEHFSARWGQESR
jgi:thiamine biosynthesis lipoprotein